ncbi:insulinase family protein [bacterium]|nr:insulinase family protein [bacterium]
MAEDLREVTLQNGVQVAIENNPSSYSVSLGILVKVGAKDEEDEKAGIAHLLEHMLFRGSKRYERTEIAKITDMLGGDFNGLTHKDYTFFYIRVPHDKLDIGMDVLFDIFLNPTLAEEDLEKEKQVILEEIRDRDNDPEEVAKEKILSLAWDGHPIGRSILGTEETLLSIGKKDLENFLSLYHNPQAIIVSAAGRIDDSSFLKKVENLLLPINGCKKPPNEPPSFRAGESTVLHPTTQVHLCIAMESAKARDDFHYSYSVLATLLGGGTASRLFQKLREERGLCYDVEAEDLALEDCGILNIYSASHPNNKELLRELIEEELVSLRDKGVDRDELERAKRQLQNAILLSLETSLQRMMRIALSLFYRGRIVPIEETLERIERVSEEDVQEAINRSLNKGIAVFSLMPA